jgi:hypothetical protein
VLKGTIRRSEIIFSQNKSEFVQSIIRDDWGNVSSYEKYGWE